MILCPKCKKLIDDNAAYCPYCETEFRNTDKGNEQHFQENGGNRRLLPVFMAFTILALITCFAVYFRTRDPQNNTTNVVVSNKSASHKTNTNVRAVPEPVNLPDELFFMRNLDPKKNNDGTYSFRGSFTSYDIAKYCTTPTLYITAVNGRKFSTGDTSLYYQTYINNSGEFSVVLSDIVDAPAQIRGIIFEFVYDSNGNFVTLRR